MIIERRATSASFVGVERVGGFTGLLLGSVGHFRTQNAPCALVVVPPPRGRRSVSRREA
jgi:hypothetical protein